MNLVLASGRQFTKESLTSFITGHFGAAARFHTCSASGMTARELVDFLAVRGKFIGPEEAFTVNPQRVCRH